MRNGILLTSFFIGLLLLSCDGGVIVQAEFAKENQPSKGCEVSLWNERAPFWSEPKPQKIRSKIVDGENINFQWTISGTKVRHWIEIECPGYKTYRSNDFLAPSNKRLVDLGKIAFEKLD